MSENATTLSRRAFLLGSGATVGGLWLGLFGRRVRAVAASAPLPGLFPNAFLRIAPDGAVTILCARSEMGQGVRSALPMLIADELGASLDHVTIEQADGDARYGNQNTDGSSSVRGKLDELRRLGAVGRTLLVRAAATQWGVAPEECEARDHTITHSRSKRTLAFAAVVEAAAKLPVPKAKEVRLRPRSELPHLGKAAPHVDAKAMSMGAAHYGADIVLPGMLTAVIARPPSLFDSLASVDSAAALRVPGVKHVVELKSPSGAAGFSPLGGVAVVADNTWAALRGREALVIEWSRGANRDYDSAAYRQSLLATVRGECKPVRSTGDVAKALANATRVVSAEYTVPHLAQAPMEPPAAVASFADGKCEVWAPTQDPQTARNEIADALGIGADKVTVHVTFLGGGFGRKSKPDFIVEAALLSKRVGAPLRVQWTRRDDLAHGYYHTVSAQRFDVAIEGTANDATVVGWRHRTVFPPIRGTFVKLIKTPSAGELAQGASDLPFAVPSFRVEAGEAVGHARIGWMRSVCNIFHGYAVGSFVDELAIATKRDTKAMWLELLGPPRALTPKEAGGSLDNYGASLDEHPIDTGRLRNVIERVTEQSGFAAHTVKDGFAYGLAAHRSFLSYVAVVVKIAARPDGGWRLDEAWVSVDAGTILNRDRVVAQMEGAVVFGLSIFLHGAITMKDGIVEQQNFRDYRLARFSDAPRAIHVDIVASDKPAGGVGEPGVPPVAPAIGNAVFALRGERVRDLPYLRWKKPT